METDATRMCALMVGLPDVNVIGVDDWPRWLRVVVETPTDRPGRSCGGVVHRHGIREARVRRPASVRAADQIGVAQATLALHNVRPLLV